MVARPRAREVTRELQATVGRGDRGEHDVRYVEAVVVGADHVGRAHRALDRHELVEFRRADVPVHGALVADGPIARPQSGTGDVREGHLDLIQIGRRARRVPVRHLEHAADPDDRGRGGRRALERLDGDVVDAAIGDARPADLAAGDPGAPALAEAARTRAIVVRRQVPHAVAVVVEVTLLEHAETDRAIADDRLRRHRGHAHRAGQGDHTGEHPPPPGLFHEPPPHMGFPARGLQSELRLRQRGDRSAAVEVRVGTSDAVTAAPPRPASRGRVLVQRCVGTSLLRRP